MTRVCLGVLAMLLGNAAAEGEPRPEIDASAKRERSLGEASSATGEPCRPRAALDGDAEAVQRVGQELVRLGVDVEKPAGPADLGRPARGCSRVVAAVELDRGGGIAVSVRDGAQRSEGRIVSDAAVAAAWIDSWVRDGFEPVEPAPTASVMPLRVSTPAPVVSSPGIFDRGSIAVGYLEQWTSDRTSWTGLGGGACMHAGAFCVGGRASYARQQIAADLTEARRGDLSVMATASWSHALGQMTLVPELGVGVARTTTARVDGCAKIAPPQSCDPMDPNCAPPPCTADAGQAVFVGDNFQTSTISPRIAGAVRVAVPLFAHVWLDGVAEATFTPLAHTSSYPLGNNVPIPGQNGTEPPFTPDQVAIPGESRFGVTLGVGIRVGAP